MKDKILDNKGYKAATQIIIGVIRIVEILLAGLIVLGVIISFIDIFSSSTFQKLDFQSGYFNYQTFQEFLAFILLLVVGLELAIMLVKHTAESVVEVMLYAVARKMLIYNTTSTEILMGVITLAILYAIKIYMLKDSNDRIRRGVYNIFKKIQRKEEVTARSVGLEKDKDKE